MMALVLLLATSMSHAGEISVIGALVREAALQPGETAEGVILVQNNEDVPRDVIAHLSDYTFAADGSNDFATAGTNPRSNSAWVHFTPNQATVPPHETVSIYYTMEAPADPGFRGTYWSLLMVESPPLAAADPARGGSVQIRTVIRYGVQLVTHLGAPEPGVLSFVASTLGQSDGHTTLALDIGNTGTRLLSPAVWLDVFDATGTNLGRFRSKRQSGLLPGCSARYVVDLGALAPGEYTGLAIADAGLDQVFGAEYTLDLRL
jgi:hypothetical protein